MNPDQLYAFDANDLIKRCRRCKAVKRYADFPLKKTKRFGERPGAICLECGKQCKRCREWKPYTEYTKCNDGVRPYCKSCAPVLLKEWREANPDHVKDYHRKYNAARGADPEYVEKVQAQRRQRYIEDPDHFRSQQLMRQFGITLAEKEEMAAVQGGVCAICKKPCGTGRMLALDHDHSHHPDGGTPYGHHQACRECLRGLLCQRCNHMIGLAGDDVEVLQAAIDYLEKWMSNRSWVR
jgi:hypothetical protein